MTAWLREQAPARQRAICEQVMQLLGAGVLCPLAGKVFELDSVAAAVAHAFQAGRADGGKPLLSLS